MGKSKANERTIIGIDFGFQNTKGAISFPQSRDEALTHLKLSELEPRDLLPTKVRHEDADGCERDYGWFKLLALSSATVTTNELSGNLSCDLARTLLSKFLRQLSRLIRTFYEAEIDRFYEDHPPWYDAKIDFVLSVPSAVGAEGALVLQTAAEKAFSFRSKKGKHKVRNIVVTEAEAAAICVVKEMSADIKVGERVLVLDVGGGTSDVTMIIVTEKGTWKHDNIVLHPVTSERLGGAYVDRDIQYGILDLMMLAGIFHDDAVFMAEHICRSKDFSEAKEGQANLEIDLSALGPSKKAVTSGMEIFNKRLFIHPDYFDTTLDKQLFGPGGESNRANGIVEQVVTMRDDLLQLAPSESDKFKKSFERETSASEKIDVVVFSGGVCKSAYLREKVKTYLQMVPEALNETGLEKIMSETRFLATKSPQLCVAKGLVYARIQELDADNESLLETWFRRLRS